MVSYSLLEFGRVALESISRPLSKRICIYAENHRVFRICCVSTARTLSNYYRACRWTKTHFNQRKGIHIVPMEESRAIELGSRILSELIVLSIPMTFIIASLYYKRTEEYARTNEISNMKNQIQSINNQLTDISDKMNEIGNILQFLEIGENKLEQHNILNEDTIETAVNSNEELNIAPQITPIDSNANIHKQITLQPQ